MTFTLTIKCDNAAFDDDTRNDEVAAILRNAAREVENGFTENGVQDSNGNHVGNWRFTGHRS